MPVYILSVDTATEVCGVALSVDGQIRAELILDRGVTHTQNIMNAIDTVLTMNNIEIGAIDAYAVSRGPGSFTGLRIGISTVKGLALATAKPIVGISALEVLANQASGDTIFVCPLIDARRNEVYWSLYERHEAEIKSVLDERVGPVEEIAGMISKSCYFIGNGVPPYQFRIRNMMNQPAQWATDASNSIRPSVLARLAWQRFLKNEVDDIQNFAPVYIRKSDAELSRH